MEVNAKPLDKFPAIRSRDTGEIEHLLAATYGARRFALKSAQEKLSVRANHWQSKAISLAYCNYGAEVEVGFPEADFYRQQFALKGGATISMGGASRDISAKSFCIVPPGTPLVIGFRPDYEQMVLRIDSGFLQSKWAALHGGNTGIRLSVKQHAGGPAMDRLRRLIGHFISELERESPPAEIELAELEQAIAVSFLYANPAGGFDNETASPAGAAQSQLRMVEDYIQAHWNEPLSLESISSQFGVSARTVFYHFRKWRNKTPIAYLKEVRLREARKRLLAVPQMSVTQIALECGFGNLGHFAVDYRKHWGEKPSQTRARSRLERSAKDRS